MPLLDSECERHMDDLVEYIHQDRREGRNINNTLLGLPRINYKKRIGSASSGRMHAEQVSLRHLAR